MTIPAELRYTDSHEWVRVDTDGVVTVGITWHAQELLGDLVYVETPAVGAAFTKGQSCGAVESVKAASEIYAPVSGAIVAVNEMLATNPEHVNADPYTAWMFKLKPQHPAELAGLLDASGYEKLVTGEGS